MPPHAHWVYQNIREHDIINMRNVRVKENHNASGTLEGNLYPDKYYPEKICVSKASDGEIATAELVGRQREYRTRTMGEFLNGKRQEEGEKKKKNRVKKKNKGAAEVGQEKSTDTGGPAHASNEAPDEPRHGADQEPPAEKYGAKRATLGM